jgi:hypothetical protein
LSQEIGAQPAEIWIIHSPPDRAKTGITRGGVGFGDFAFGEQCWGGLGPRLALSGHVHDPQSWRTKLGRTWSLNPGYAETLTLPRHIVIDLKRNRAIWYGPIGVSGRPTSTVSGRCSGADGLALSFAVALLGFFVFNSSATPAGEPTNEANDEHEDSGKRHRSR